MTEVEQQQRITDALLAAASDLARVTDTDALVESILQRSREVMRCFACSVSLPADDHSGDLLIRSTERDLNDGAPLRIPSSQGIAGQVFLNRQPVNIRDAAEHAAHYKKIGQTTGTAAAAMLTIPLLDAENCHGVMQALNPQDRPHFDDGDERVFAAFGSLIAITLSRIAAAQEERTRAIGDAVRAAELELAADVQCSFLPQDKIESGRFSVRCFHEQAGEVGGDLFFCHALPGGQILLGAGDITGKGFSAALDMARACTLITVLAPDASEVAFDVWVGKLNLALFRAMRESGNYLALSVLLVEPERGIVHAANFGQSQPLAQNWSGAWFELGCPQHGLLGLTEQDQFEIQSYPLGAARRWLLHSDGIGEAQDSKGEDFRGAPMEAALADAGEDLLGDIETAWRAFYGGGPAGDDATMALLSDSGDAPIDHFTFPCTPENITAARGFFRSHCAHAGVDTKRAELAVLGCDEILTNIYKHAYQREPGEVRCRANPGKSGLTFAFDHDGKPFDGIPPEGHLPSEDSGGYGLSVIAEAFSGVEFDGREIRADVEI